MVKITPIFGVRPNVEHFETRIRINSRYLSFPEGFENLVPKKKEMTHSVGLSK
ncbi:hypothetical protein ACFSFY_07035 [Sporosarcina siberiensis]|uniref:Uncharacterized protein n=1 Tax=Sporosarcina siberiensis TaxID=1365606 RepID=A0ABW4SEK3_9BACL